MSTVRVVWSASGAARDASLSIADQAKRARQQYPTASASIVTLRDDAQGAIAAHGGEEVAVRVELLIEVQSVEAPAVADVVADVEALVEEAPKRRRWA